MSDWTIHPEELVALKTLWEMAQQDCGGGRVCARLLLGLYNGNRFQFDLTDLRLLDDRHLHAALMVLRMDARPAMEVHDVLQHHCGFPLMGTRFEILACDWRLKGRCSAAQEKDLRRHWQEHKEAAERQRVARETGVFLC